MHIRKISKVAMRPRLAQTTTKDLGGTASLLGGIGDTLSGLSNLIYGVLVWSKG